MTRAHGRLTRRDVIGGFAAAGAGALLGPPAARAAASPQGERVFSRRVGRVSGLSEAIAPGRGFVLAGVQWSGPPGARIELRSRTGRGSWGRWGIASVRGHEPDRGVTGSALFGDGLWLGRSDAVQLRSSQPVDGVRVHFIAPQDATPAVASAAALPLATPQLPAGGGQPPIIARSAWAGSAAAPSAGPYYGSVQLAFVHHSDNPNGYSEAEVPGMILSIYDYHRYVHGWFDIGYNFVIDAFGRVWEARAGGIDEPVIGAQAGGYNEVSTGVVILGTFMSVSPTPAAIAALERLLAWKLPLHGVPALGTVTVEVDPADAFYTPFEPGQRVPLPRIAGHRDGDTTDCPGDVLYGELASIRSAV
ncbi:MAG: N-acetylmuramoyl-L-alanine amidase, partial [Solirubrobacteraceae bacterium]